MTRDIVFLFSASSLRSLFIVPYKYYIIKLSTETSCYQKIRTEIIIRQPRVSGSIYFAVYTQLFSRDNFAANQRVIKRTGPGARVQFVN